MVIKFDKTFYWGLGIGDWGLGIEDWAQGQIPKPKTPNHQTPNPLKKTYKIKQYLFEIYIIGDWGLGIGN